MFKVENDITTHLEAVTQNAMIVQELEVLVENIMTTDLIVVTPETSVSQAMKVLTENEITGMPVVDNDMNLVGVMSEKDVLEMLHDIKNDTLMVEQFMTTDVVSFEQDSNLLDICRFLIKKDFRRVPITLEGKLVGILTRKDILHCIVDYQNLFEEVLPKNINYPELED